MTTSPGEHPSEVHQLIIDAAAGARQLTAGELRRVLAHVAHAGFDPNATEQARGRLAGIEWQGRILRGSDRLAPAEAHYLRHVVVRQEWPVGTSLSEYLRSIEQVVLDERSGVLVGQYQVDGNWQLTVVRRSGSPRGPGGFDWIVVDYRVATGHWVTAFQPEEGIERIQGGERKDSRWLRPPR